MKETVPSKALSVTLLLLSTLPLLRLVHAHLPNPSLYLLLPLFDHISSAIFAARYLTFLTQYPPYSPRNIYPFLLPYAPLLQLSHSLFHSPASIKHTVLSHTGAPAPSYNGCQARFTIFISTNAVLILSVLQVMYGVPGGVSHYLGLLLPTLVVLLREGCSLFTVAWIALFVKLGNVASLAYLIITAVYSLREGVSLERVLLAPKGDWLDYMYREGEQKNLLRKGEVSDVSESTEVDDGIEISNDGAAKM